MREIVHFVFCDINNFSNPVANRMRSRDLPLTILIGYTEAHQTGKAWLSVRVFVLCKALYVQNGHNNRTFKFCIYLAISEVFFFFFLENDLILELKSNSCKTFTFFRFVLSWVSQLGPIEEDLQFYELG